MLVMLAGVSLASDIAQICLLGIIVFLFAIGLTARMLVWLLYANCAWVVVLVLLLLHSMNLLLVLANMCRRRRVGPLMLRLLLLASGMTVLVWVSIGHRLKGWRNAITCLLVQCRLAH